MTAKQPNITGTLAESRILLEEYKIDLPLVLRQLRMCRSTIGSILELLESHPPTPEMLEQVNGAASDATSDVERLWNLIKPLR